MTDELAERISRLRREINGSKLDGILITDRMNSLYISGFPCSNSTVLITRRAAVFLTDFRYKESARKSIQHMEVRIIPQRAVMEIGDLAGKLKIKNLGFEETTSFGEWKALTAALGTAVTLIPAGAIMGRLRQVKSESEIRLIAANQKLNGKIFTEAASKVKAGDTESGIHASILRAMIDNKCEEAFGSIIAAGKNSALPHAVPSTTRIKRNQFLLFDMGIKRNFYHSDMTRTIVSGDRLSDQGKEIYEVVKTAQAEALKALKPGVLCKEVDKVARDIIAKAGYGDYFGHGLGHGVGLEIHEGPSLNPRSEEKLETGMTVTVEPGIYIPEIGGVRIEDLVVITENGYKNLTPISKELTFKPI